MSEIKDIFGHLNNITEDKRFWHQLSVQEQKTANIYLLNRFISMKYDYIGIVNEIQNLNAPPSYVYNLYISIIPKQKTFFKYLKKSIKEIKGDDLEIISKVFEVSEREAKEYIELLDKGQLESLKEQINGIKSKKKK